MRTAIGWAVTVLWFMLLAFVTLKYDDLEKPLRYSLIAVLILFSPALSDLLPKKRRRGGQTDDTTDRPRD